MKVLTVDQNRKTLALRTLRATFEATKELRAAAARAAAAPDYFTWALQRERRAAARRLVIR